VSEAAGFGADAGARGTVVLAGFARTVRQSPPHHDEKGNAIMTRSIGIDAAGTATPVSGLAAPRYTRAVQRLMLLLIGLGLALVSPVQAQTVEYYHLDALGSVRAVTDASGAVLRRHDYKPFGEEVPISSQVALGDKKLFTGHEHDNETALDYFGARYYRADVGRFTTVDPAMTIKDNLVDPQRWNRYAYVANNPPKFTDPDGKNPLLIAGGIGAAVYGGFAIYQNISNGAPHWYNNVGVEATKGLVVGLTLGLAGPALASAEIPLGVAATGTGQVIAGPYGEVTREALERAASSAGSTVGVVTRLTSAPQAGRALSAAGGQGAEALANAARSGGSLFSAQIPSALLKELQGAGLVEMKTALMNGVVSTEYRFLPNATEFIVKYFEKQ
jgi:RHS repeat-associated protein